MKTEEVRKIVEREIGPIKGRLNIDHWNIGVGYSLGNTERKLTGGGSATRAAQCCFSHDYDRAQIEFNPEGLDSEEEVIRVLRHELIHIVFAPFRLFAVNALLVAKNEASTILDSLRNTTEERLVVILERILDGLSDG